MIRSFAAGAPIVLAGLLAASGCATASRPATGHPSPAPAATSPEKLDAFHDLLVDAKACDTPTPRAVRRADLAADLPAVARVLRRGWAGLGPREKQGLDVGRLLASAKKDLGSLPETMPSGDAVHWLAHAFGAARDGHLAFFAVDANGRWHFASTGVHADAYASTIRLTHAKDGWRVTEGGKDGPAAGATFVSCARAGVHVRPTLLGRAPRLGGLLVLESEAAPRPLHCRFRDAKGEAQVVTLPLHPVAVDRPPHQDAAFTETDGEVPVLRVRSFGGMFRGDLLRFVASAPALRDRKAIILDLRGNRGGSDTFPLDFMKGLTSGPLAYHEIDRLQTEVTLQGDVNWTTCELADHHLGAAARKHFVRRNAETHAALDYAISKVGHPYEDWKKWTPMDRGTAPSPFTGTLVLLVDRHCASACESMIMYARQIPGTILVGENTAGVGVFGEVRRYPLAHTHLWMQAGEKWFHGPASVPDADEGKGYLPDVWVDGAPALAAATDVARCLADTKCGATLRQALAAMARGRVRQVIATPGHRG